MKEQENSYCVGIASRTGDPLQTFPFKQMHNLSTKIVLLSLHSVLCATAFVLISEFFYALLPTQMANI